MKISNRIGELLAERGWAQMPFAAECDMDQSQLSRIKTGKVVPALATAIRISRGFGLSVEDVFQLESD